MANGTLGGIILMEIGLIFIYIILKYDNND
jgi:hypothetical protein